MSTSRFSRRKFLGRSLAGAAALTAQQWLARATCAAAPAGIPATTTTSPAAPVPMLYWTGDREASLSWPVTTASHGWVEFGPTPDLGTKSIAGDDVTDYLEGFSPTALGSAADTSNPHVDPHVLRARLKNLTPGKRVYYRVHTQSEAGGLSLVGEIRQFTLPDANASRAKIAVWNDTHDRRDVIRSRFALTSRDLPDLLVWNGDASNNIDRDEQIASTYLSPGGLDLTCDFPMVFSRGNHDVRGAMAVRFGHYSAMRSSYYSFRIGPVAAIVLDAGEDKPDNHSTFLGRPAFEPLLQKEAQWLAEEIKRPTIAQAPYRLVFCHVPLRWINEAKPDYSKTGYDLYTLRGRNLWHESLVKWKAQLVISGHTHQQRFIPADASFPYAQLVGGGPEANNATVLRLEADAKTLFIHVLDLTGKSLREESLSPL